MKEVLLIIDMQNDFIDGSLGTKEAQAIVPKVTELAKKSENIIFTQDTHAKNYLETQEGKNLPIEHCIMNSHGWEICDALKSFITDHNVFTKPTFGCTRLIHAISDYDTIVLVGLCTDICVISNALLIKDYYPEKKIIVDSSCCAGVTPESHKNALNAMKSCQIEIR